MLKRLEIESLQADLATVKALLAGRTKEEDPLGWHQLSNRRRYLEEDLAKLTAEACHAAAVALYFGGRPVLGSRGIVADFGARAVEQFQTLVSTQFGALDGPLAAKGPIKAKGRTQFMITDVARGSFGFVLEEIGAEQMVDTPLKDVLERLLDTLYRTASTDEAAFEEAAEAIDDRLLASLRSFFKTLDDGGATLRLVENERDFFLNRDAVSLGRERVEDLKIDESTAEVDGTLYYAPKSGRFDLYQINGEVLNGRIGPEGLAALTDENGAPLEGIVGTLKRVILRSRKVTTRGRQPKVSHTLISVSDIPA